MRGTGDPQKFRLGAWRRPWFGGFLEETPAMGVLNRRAKAASFPASWGSGLVAVAPG